MVTLGADTHKRTHTLVAVDATGRKLAERTVPATSPGHLELLRWAAHWPERSWALEDCRHLSRRLSTDLLVAGERVIRVPPKLMASARRSSREPGGTGRRRKTSRAFERRRTRSGRRFTRPRARSSSSDGTSGTSKGTRPE